MSVIVTLYIQGDAAKLEAYAAENREHMSSIIDRAKEHGVIAHRFYGTDEQILVLDEWPDGESFQAFFAASQDQIGPMMQAVGVEGEPAVHVWRKLDTGDDVGWGA